MVIAEAPGSTEDEKGVPLIGQSGDLLRKTLAMAQLSLEHDVYLTNVVRCWPGKGNRNPTEEEIDNCMKWLYMEWQMVQPAVVLVLGKIADKAVAAMMQRYDVPAPHKMEHFYHPSYILRTPRAKRAWEEGIVAWLTGHETINGLPPEWEYGVPEGDILGIDTEYDVEDGGWNGKPVSWQISDGRKAMFIPFE